jgi:hypothetical protein
MPDGSGLVSVQEDFGVVTRPVTLNLTCLGGGFRRCRVPHAVVCPIASDHVSLFKRALALPRVQDSLWAVGIKKSIVVLDVQRGTCVTEARMRITEVPAKRAGRQRYHDLQDVRICIYSTTLQCGTARLTALRRGWQGP